MNTLKIEAKLADTYKYQRLSADLSEIYREFFRSNIPDWLSEDGSDETLFTTNGSVICKGYDRIVVGDYGAFIEFSEERLPDQYPTPTLVVPADQRFRIEDERYSGHVKYVWMTVPDGSGVKVYLQKKKVTYADYKPGKYYVSVHEVKRG
jgi:hypothetical protein